MMAGHGNSRQYSNEFRFWRRTQHCDVQDIIKLFRGKMTRELFGDVNVSDLIEMSYLSIATLDRSRGNIIACIMLCDFPNVPAVPRWCWVDWLRQHYRLEWASVQNTLFVHLLVWDSHHTHRFLQPLLYSVFMSCLHLQNIVIVVPPGAKTYDILDEYFSQIFPQPKKQFSKVQTILLCMRQQLVTRLKMREAIEEDNDDLMPILDKTGQLMEEFGEFYASDLIRTSDETRKIIVAEAEGKVIGVMCITSRVDYASLGEIFELGSFNGLKSPSMVSREHPVTRSSSVGQLEFRRSIPAEGSSVNAGLFEGEEVVALPEIIHRTSTISVHRRSISYPELGVKKSAGIVVHEGSPNAFMIEVFALHEDVDERCSFDLLEAAFDCFPELDYCIITQPSVFPVHPLLEHFVRVPSKAVFSLSAELCVAHRNSVLSELVVRQATREDFSSLQTLFGRIEKCDTILADFLSSLPPAETSLQTFVITTEESIVGLAIISGGEDVSYLWAHYQLDLYTLYRAHSREQHGLVLHLVLSPAFNCHARHFLAEIHRQSDITCLYYLLPSLPPAKIPTVSSSTKGPALRDKCLTVQGAVTILAYMIPVLPRRRMEYDLAKLSGNKPSDCVLSSRIPCALYHMNKRFSSLRKTTVGTRIVVVSISATALAFLERLLFGPWCVYLTFFNVSVVSPRGLPGASAEQFLPQRSHFSHAYVSLLSLPTWVNVICADVTAIDRQEKHVHLNGESTLSYDYLLFFDDEIFMNPQCNCFAHHPYTAQCTVSAREDAETLLRKLQNVFYINSEEDAISALAAVTSIASKLQEYNVVVYGHNVEAFCCVGAFIEHGISGHCISFVEPFSLPSATCFDNQAVYDAVLAEMRKQGVQTFSGCHFNHWVIHRDKPVITTVAFETEEKCFYMECTALMFYGNKDVNDKLFGVLNDASLVYDGRLVINTRFQTNDPHILAAGCLTKYARNLYADRFNHSMYNPVEVGVKVADTMIKQWDPIKSREAVDESMKLPHIFTEPLVVNCYLPGRIHYLHVKKPGAMLHVEDNTRQDNSGIVLRTGDCCNRNYFRLHLDAYNKLDTITCYTDKVIPVSNLISLYGKHEQLLNNLLVRFNTGCVTDLYEYFSEPWAYAIFHDKFRSFHELMQKMFSSHTLVAGENDTSCQLADEVVKYVSDNLHHLPMYANPHLLKLLHYEREASPLHKKH